MHVPFAVAAPISIVMNKRDLLGSVLLPHLHVTGVIADSLARRSTARLLKNAAFPNRRAIAIVSGVFAAAEVPFFPRERVW